VSPYRQPEGGRGLGGAPLKIDAPSVIVTRAGRWQLGFGLAVSASTMIGTVGQRWIHGTAKAYFALAVLAVVLVTGFMWLRSIRRLNRALNVQDRRARLAHRRALDARLARLLAFPANGDD
jgi:hypothetical protein